MTSDFIRLKKMHTCDKKTYIVYNSHTNKPFNHII